jgi:hypothetical protein
MTPQPLFGSAHIFTAYPLRGLLGEHCYVRLHSGGEQAIEVAVRMSPTHRGLWEGCFPLRSTGVLADEPTPFPVRVLPGWDRVPLDTRRVDIAPAQLIRAWLVRP